MQIDNRYLLLLSFVIFTKMGFSQSPPDIVRAFLTNVRSGRHPEKASEYMADTVLAHQMNAENPTTVKRTPANYTEHVKEFLNLFGNFDFEISELISADNKVYARWIQRGTHIAELEGFPATFLPLIEYTSAVYRIEGGKIAEYWLQTDRYGMMEQLKKNVLQSGLRDRRN